MEKTIKLAEAQMTFDNWFSLCSELSIDSNSLSVLALRKMAATAVTSGNWYSTQILACGLGMDEEESLAFRMMQETAETFIDWFEIAHICAMRLMDFIGNDINPETSRDFDELNESLEKAKSEMLKFNATYSEWYDALTEINFELELLEFMLEMATKVASSPIDYARLYRVNVKNEELRREILSQAHSAKCTFAEWFEAYDSYTTFVNRDDELKLLFLQKMSESYTTLSEFEKIKKLSDDECYYEEILSKSLTNDQWRTFFGFTE